MKANDQAVPEELWRLDDTLVLVGGAMVPAGTDLSWVRRVFVSDRSVTAEEVRNGSYVYDLFGWCEERGIRC